MPLEPWGNPSGERRSIANETDLVIHFLGVNKLAKPMVRAVGYLATVAFPVLVGWGVDDLSRFFREPARTWYIILGVLGLVTLLNPRLTPTRPARAARR